MVALKRMTSNALYPAPKVKQERRGGIETPMPLTASQGASIRKQERRGGIETIRPTIARLPRPAEAGTPWWH